MKKIEIFSFDLKYIKEEIRKEIEKKEEIKNMKIFKEIIDSINNDDFLMINSSKMIIKALADFEDGIVKHNFESILLTSSFLLTYKNIFNNNENMYDFSFLIEGNKLFLKYHNKKFEDDIYDYKIVNAIELFKKTMTEEENYQIIIKEIIINFFEKVNFTCQYISNLIETKENITEDEVIKEIFFNLTEHQAYNEYNKYKEWKLKNDNRTE